MDTKVAIKCRKCGKDFEVWRSREAIQHPKYCSPECYQASRGPRGPYRKTKREPRACETCGQEFVPRNDKTRFCSRSCLYTFLSSPQGPAYKNGSHTTAQGYVWTHAPDHPDVQGNGYVREHRLVMERILGRTLTKDESVHHINGDVSDNRPENLQLLHAFHGKGVAYVCQDCGSCNVAAVPLATSV